MLSTAWILHTRAVYSLDTVYCTRVLSTAWTLYTRVLSTAWALYMCATAWALYMSVVYSLDTLHVYCPQHEGSPSSAAAQEWPELTAPGLKSYCVLEQ